jgi:chloramphenicol 3-O phosphotransferase
MYEGGIVLKQGKIIILNGTSSSGKTTLAKSLEQVLDEPYVYVSLDDLLEPVTNLYFANLPPSKEMGKAGQMIVPKVASLMLHTISALALLGQNIIVDHVMIDKGSMMEWIETLSCYPVTFVGVQCPLEELEFRELARGDRSVGLAKSQIDNIHANKDYDLTVDTFKYDPIECAIQVKRVLNTSPGGSFIRMKSNIVTT